MDEKQALLEQLQAPRLPEVSNLPAIGWWLLLLLCLIAMFFLFWYLRRLRARYWLQEARSELAGLRNDVDKVSSSEILSRTSRLVRRVLLLARPREEAASLQGEALLASLDDVCGQPLFSNGFGRLLLTGPYERSPEVGPKDLTALLDSVEQLCKGAAKKPGSRSASE